jgi:hypothetical protein
MDDQLSGLRSATTAGVKARVGRTLALMMAMSRSRHDVIVRQIRDVVFRTPYGSFARVPVRHRSRPVPGIEIRRAAAALATVTVAAAIWFAASASAAFPGANGLLAVQPRAGGGVLLVAALAMRGSC